MSGRQLKPGPDVDRLFEDMTGAGYASQTTPADAFWGARYAIVEDPDGSAIGFMSPIDRPEWAIAEGIQHFTECV